MSTDLSEIVEAEQQTTRRSGRRRRRARAGQEAMSRPVDGRVNPYATWAEGARRPRFRLSAKDKVIWLSALAQQVAAGLTPQDSLGTIGADANIKHKRGLSEASAWAEEMMSRGYSFADAMAMTAAIDDAAIVALRAGQDAGRIDSALSQSAERLERVYKIRSKVRGALVMPLITFLIAIAIAWILVRTVVPTLLSVFSQLGHKMPMTTRIMLTASRDFTSAMLVVILALVVFAGVYRLVRRSEPARIRIDRFKLHLPVLGAMLHDSALASTYQTLGLLLSTGVTNSQALASAAGSNKNAAVRDVFVRAGRAAEEVGAKLSESLAHEPLIPAVDVALIKAGEKAGRSSGGVTKAADFHFVASDERAAQVADAVSPILTVFVGGLIAFIAFSIYIPVFQMDTLFGQQV